MKIYIDLLFIQDTIMMIMLLKIASYIMKLRISMSRLITVSVISNILSILLLIFAPTWWDNVLIKFLISFCIVKSGFRLKHSSQIVSRTILFWIIAFVIGGANLFFQQNSILTIIMVAVSILVVMKFQKESQKQRYLEGVTCWLEWKDKQNTYRLKVLVDTGHNVKTVYGENVIFIKDELKWKGDDQHKRIVKFQTIAGEECLTGSKVNDICITYKKQKIYQNAVVIQTAHIAQNYDAIIGYDLLEGGMVDGNTIINEAKSKETIS